MGVDFDVLEFCKKLRQDRPPPYQCPLERCDRVYKSLCGLQYHLVRVDHGALGPDAPAPPAPTPSSSRKKGRSRPPNSTADIALKTPPREALTFAEAQKVVQFEIDGKISRVTIDQVLPVMSLDDWTKKNSELEKPMVFVDPIPEPHIKLPEASFKILDDYNISDAPTRPNAYIRFIEKSAEELDGEVEYDVDEEDTAWLGIINERRQKQNLPNVSIDTLELLMDRLEKESYFQATQSGQASGTVVDEDAVCCICMDGECQNTNVILFCDMCNLAVHQDCYGVPYIPEGQWLCRRCLQSPSRLVDCVLCPNTGGAFKQTDRGNWAHVVCALWIPEVRFANTVFLEPIDSIETIPTARWKLICYICKQRGVGACIQCHRANCYAAFHVTCAQQAGLHMRMDAVNGSGRGGSLDPSQAIHVAKIAYCDAHTPPGAKQEIKEDEKSGSEKNAVVSTSHKRQSFMNKVQARTECREKMKQARRLLAKKRSSVPVVLIPTIPPERVQEIASLVQIAGRAHFVQRLIAYWTLKRQYRNGVPLLRRLQSLNHHAAGASRSVQEGAVNTRELYNQLKYWQRIRQDLERARLLCELVRKRERVKAEYTRVKERWLFHQLKPMEAILRKVLNLLITKDTSDIFSEPVDPTEVPDYSSVVTHPMDLSTMMRKLDQGIYINLDMLESDFNLMIDNCLAYNSKDTVFYKAGVKMMEQGRSLLAQARKDMVEAGFIDPSNTSSGQDRPKGLKKLRDKTPLSSPSKHYKIFDKSDHSQDEKVEEDDDDLPPLSKIQKKSPEPVVVKKNKRGRPPRKKIERRGLVGRKPKPKPVVSEHSNSDQGDEDEEMLSQTSTKTPISNTDLNRTPNKLTPTHSTPGEPSPTGVNRRTAVLFTRKGQSAFGNIRTPKRPELSALSQSPSPSTIPSSSHTHILTNGTEPTLDSLAASVSNETPAEPIVKKKGRGRPRKHKLNPADGKSKNDGDKLQNMSSQTPVPASFLQYRGPRDEVGSGVDSDSAHSSGSYSSSCSSCTHFDDGLSSCSDSCSLTSGSDRSSFFNETMDSTTNQTMSDTENNVTRMSGKLSSSDKKLIAPSHWSSDQSESNSQLSHIKNKKKSKLQQKSSSKSHKDMDIEHMDTNNLAPLQLVWAKCRGYPWYPALIIDPKIPKGFMHNGVPLPVPPQDVLALKKNHPNEPILYLVLFFDAKRTWQWLPPNKLEPLGIKKAIDQAKLIESRKPTDRKAVKKAYQDAMQYNKQVDGEPFSNK